MDQRHKVQMWTLPSLSISGGREELDLSFGIRPFPNPHLDPFTESKAISVPWPQMTWAECSLCLSLTAQARTTAQVAAHKEAARWVFSAQSVHPDLLTSFYDTMWLAQTGVWLIQQLASIHFPLIPFILGKKNEGLCTPTCKHLNWSCWGRLPNLITSFQRLRLRRTGQLMLQVSKGYS